MLSTAQDAYQRARVRIGKLARRVEEDLMVPSERDEDALQQYLEDSLVRIGTETDRLTTIIELFTTPGQEYVQQPPHLDRIEEASIIKNSTAYVLELNGGQDVALWARDPQAHEALPEYIGAYNDRLYLFPVPDKEYPIDLEATLNGQVSDNGSSPTVPDDPPELDTVVARVPGDFNEAVVRFLVGRWMMEVGQPEIGQKELNLFQRHLREHDKEPSTPSRATRDYNII
jgi:hypothetical protein